MTTANELLDRVWDEARRVSAVLDSLGIPVTTVSVHAATYMPVPAFSVQLGSVADVDRAAEALGFGPDDGGPAESNYTRRSDGARYVGGSVYCGRPEVPAVKA